jgi:polysaccharide biosynthesis protein PelC
MKRIQWIIHIVTILVVMSLFGCAKTYLQGYLNPNLSISNIKSIALIPFDNISGHPDAGRKIENLLLIELARKQTFILADMGEVEKSLRELRIRNSSEIDLSKLKKLGEQLKIQAVIIGSVDEYELRQDKSGMIPVVALNARMLDVQTGDIVWAINNSHDGNDWEKMFGFGKIISLNQLAQITISEIVDNLVHRTSHSNK